MIDHILSNWPIYFVLILISVFVLLGLIDRRIAKRKLALAAKYRNELVGQMAEQQEQVITSKRE